MEPHPELIKLLEKHNISLTDFHKKGRPAKGDGHFLALRKAVVTEIHSMGTSWKDMMEITGLSNGAIQRLTGAMWNPESRKVVSAKGSALGRTWKGKKRPGQLEAQWKAGVFDFHRGRVPSEEERQALRDRWTEEKKVKFSAEMKLRWQDPAYRDNLLAFHRSPEERVRMSEAQSLRMSETPEVYAKGLSQWVVTPKGNKPRVFARSSYEVAAISILEGDPNVVSYEFERRIKLNGGKWILPDFLVARNDGPITLLEVKASWVLTSPKAIKERARLELAQKLASENGWGFTIWTEKELGNALKSTR